MSEDLDKVELGQDRAYRQGKAAGVRANEKICALPLEETGVLHSDVFAKFRVPKQDLDRSTEHTARGANLLGGQPRTHQDLAPVVGMRA